MDTTFPAAAPNPHRTDLQGLRAMAVLLVALAHAGVTFLAGGFVGVDVFFVLSGFLITSLMLAEVRAKGSVSLVRFYARRARRILPVAALTLVVTDIAAFFVLNFVRAGETVRDSLGAGAFMANFRYAARGVDYFARNDPPSPLLHYWSLSVEEQFYVVWPLLLSAALVGTAVRRGTRPHRERRLLSVVLLLSAASFAWSVHATATVPAAAYFSPFTRAWELGVGAAIAVAARSLAEIPAFERAVLGWLGLAAIAFAAVCYSGATPFPGTAALVPVVGAAFAIVAGLGKTTSRLAVGRLLALSPLRVIGDRSYSFYLWHWPVLVLAAAYAGHELSLGTRLILLVGAFLLSCVTYVLVEDPIRKTRSGRATGLVVVVAAGAVLATESVALAGIDRERQQFVQRYAAAPGAVHLLRAAVERRGAVMAVLPPVVSAVEAARRGAPIPVPLSPRIDQLAQYSPAVGPPAPCIAHDASTHVTEKVCRVGDLSSSRLIVIMGDSHALMWIPALLAMAARDHWAVVPLLRLGCSPDKWISDTGPAACLAWSKWAETRIEQLHPDVVLLAGSIPENASSGTTVAVDGMLGAAQTLVRSERLILVGDPESLSFQPVDCLLGPHASMATCTTTWPESSLAAYDAIARGAVRLGAGFLATRGFVCYERECPAVIAHTVVWGDNSHLTVAYSQAVAAPFRAAFVAALAKANG
jgi:peptidoglycan/LPS O-acetylase OafA/YrhL